MTWREHTQRLTANHPPVYAALYVAMGDVIDRPITVWEEMFLPAKVEETARRATTESPLGPVPLVETEAVLLSDRRAPAPARAPHWTGFALLIGATCASLFVGLGWAASRGQRLARLALGLGVAALGSILGTSGALFVFLWAFTNHEVAHHNENILQCAPFALLLGWSGLRLSMGRAGGASRTVVIALAALASSALGLLLKILPWFDQDNWQVIALLAPLWAGIALASLLAGHVFARAGSYENG